MDTPDKAADLADSQLADSSNREWLVASAQSSQFSTSLRRNRVEYSTSSNSTTTSATNQSHYGTVSGLRDGASTSEQPCELSWLMRHYQATKKRRLFLRESPSATRNGGNLVSTNYTINNHIYDNISFADSPILRSLSRKGDVAEEGHLCGHSKLLDDANPSGGRRGPFRRFFSRPFAGKFRFFLACYVLLGITVAIYSRNALSLAAVGMIANNAMNRELADILSNSDQMSGSAQLDGACPIERRTSAPNSTASHETSGGNSLGGSHLRLSIQQRIDRGELVDWTPSEQGLIFASGSVGNLLIAIPLTRLGEIYGPKWIIFAAALGATIQAALMPIVSPCNVVVVIIFQIIFNGLTYGADCVAYTLFAYWLTPTEMAFFVSCLLICYQLGTILSSFATSKILSENLPWSWCFYMPALLCGVWTLIWTLIGASDPTKSGLISSKELDFLLRNSKIAMSARETETSQELQNGRQSASPGRQQKQQSHSISWLKLAKDPNIWAICAVKFTLRWYFSVYLSLMPTYLSSVAHMSVGTIGQMSVVQSFIGLFSGILMGFLTKSLVTKRPFNISLATTRKLFQSIVNFGLAISLIAFIVYDCDQWVTIITLTIGGICINFYVAAALQLPLDLSPSHCGLITSITNTLALGQALGAPVSGLILNKGPKDRALWRIVWLVSIIMNLLSGLIFILLVDSKPRDYSKSSRSEIYEEIQTRRTTRGTTDTLRK